MAAHHLVLDEAGDDREDRATDPAAHGFTAQSANRARYRIAERAKAHVLQRGTRAIAAERTGYDLDDEIDQCCRHRSLLYPWLMFQTHNEFGSRSSSRAGKSLP